jgi:integrase
MEMATLAETYDRWINSQHFRSLAELSKKSYRESIGIMMECFGKHSETESVSRRVENFIPYLKKREVSGRSIRLRLTHVKLFFKWAGFPVQIYYRVPREEQQLNKLKHAKRWLDDKEIELCLNYKFQWAADPLLYQALVRLLIETGARLAELENMKWRDLNIAEGILTIEESKSVPRCAFFSPTTSELLRQHKKSLICLTEDQTLFKKDEVEMAIKTLLKDLGLKRPKDGRGAHTFRHYCATRMFYVGEMRIEDIAFLLGDEVSTIVSVYLHPTVSMLKRKVWTAMGWDSSSELSDPQAIVEAKQALIKLGFSRQTVKEMIGKVTYTPSMDAVNIVQEVLRNAN